MAFRTLFTMTRWTHKPLSLNMNNMDTNRVVTNKRTINVRRRPCLRLRPSRLWLSKSKIRVFSLVSINRTSAGLLTFGYSPHRFRCYHITETAAWRDSLVNVHNNRARNASSLWPIHVTLIIGHTPVTKGRWKRNRVGHWLLRWKNR